MKKFILNMIVLAVLLLGTVTGVRASENDVVTLKISLPDLNTSAEPGEALLRREYPAVDLTAKEQDTCWERRNFPNPEKEAKGDTGPVLFLSVSDGCSKAEAEKDLPGAPGRYPETGCQDRADGISPEASNHHP